MRANFHIEDAEFDEILKINKEGSDPAICISGGIPIGRSKQEKINDFWKDLGNKRGFNPDTIEPIDNRNFTAESK